MKLHLSPKVVAAVVTEVVAVVIAVVAVVVVAVVIAGMHATNKSESFKGAFYTHPFFM